jgi:hypothetical protein
MKGQQSSMALYAALAPALIGGHAGSVTTDFHPAI